MEIPNESRRHGDMPIPALACTRIDVWAKITVVLAPTAASLAIILSERLATTRCVEKRWRTGCFSPPGSQPAGGAKVPDSLFPGFGTQAGARLPRSAAGLQRSHGRRCGRLPGAGRDRAIQADRHADSYWNRRRSRRTSQSSNHFQTAEPGGSSPALERRQP